MENQVNIKPLRMIRIAKDLSLDEMASFFMVTKAYISAIEKNQRKMKPQTLKLGLESMNISMDEYFQLEEFSQELLKSELSDRNKYMAMLIKTLGVVSHELKPQSEELLEKFYYEKRIIGNNHRI